MIRYTLRCRDAHEFESWFRSATAFETLLEASQLACPECGATEVEKAMMTPRVGGREAQRPLAASAEHPLVALRREIEARSEYVGRDFAREARSMHDGAARRRSIYGEAAPREARALLEDGIPVVPLPFLPKPKLN